MNTFPLFLSLLFLGGAFCDVLTDTCVKVSKSDPGKVSVHFCIKSLEADPKSHEANLKTLGIISAKLLKANVTNTHTYIRKISKERKWSKKERSCLETCEEVYSDGISWTSEAMTYIKNEKYEDANTKLSAAMDSSVTCQDSFSEMKVKNSPLTERNSYELKLAAISLSIVDMLWSKN